MNGVSDGLNLDMAAYWRHTASVDTSNVVTSWPSTRWWPSTDSQSLPGLTSSEGGCPTDHDIFELLERVASIGHYHELEAAEQELERGGDPEYVALRISAAEIIMSESYLFRDDMRYDGGLCGDLPLYDQWIENNPHLLTNTDSESEAGAERESDLENKTDSGKY